jgi:hypothetical protein
MTNTADVIPIPRTCGLSRSWLAAFLVAAALSFVAKLAIASQTFGSNDIFFWEADLRLLRDAGPVALYENGIALRRNGIVYHHEPFNQPPFALRLLYVGGWLSDRTRLPFRFWLRASCAVADLASSLLILASMRDARLGTSSLALLLVAASPISLLISGFHGNTDPVMMAILLLAIYFANKRSALRAGCALGLAAGIKIVPLFFVPALALFLPPRKRALFVAAVVAVFAAGGLPLLMEHPILILSHVLGYTTQPTGLWGISRFVEACATRAAAVEYTFIAKWALLLVLGAISAWLNLRVPKAPLILQCALLAFTLLFLATGFGVQYLAWLVPFACLLNGRQAVAFHSIGALLLVSFYSRAAHGFPWFLADSTTTEVWNAPKIYLGLLCWLMIGWLTVCIFRRTKALQDESDPCQARHGPPNAYAEG